jgi:hypothetical protein
MNDRSDRSESRSNDRIDNRNQTRDANNNRNNRDESDLFDNRIENRPMRPRASEGQDRARPQFDANQRRFEDRPGAANGGLDTTPDRVQRNSEGFDVRTDRFSQPIDRGARFDSGVGEDELGTGMVDDPRLRRRQNDRSLRFDAGVGEDEFGAVPDDRRLRRDQFDRDASLDAGVGGDELGTALPDDPRLRRGQIDRGARFDAGAAEDEFGAGTRDDLRLRQHGAAQTGRLNGRMDTDSLGRDKMSTQNDRTRNSLDSRRQPAVRDRDVAPLTTAADPRLDAPRRTFAQETDIRSREQFRDDLGVRRNLSSGPRQTGFRGIGDATEAMDSNRERLDGNTTQSTRILSQWLDRSARGLDRLNDRLNGRPIGERIE